MKLLQIAFGMILVGACAADEKPPPTPRERCVALLDHEVDVRLSEAPAVDAEAHRKVMKRALGDRFVDYCLEHHSPKQMECALAAKSTADMADCTKK